jgi:hypothetical protein
VARSRIHGNETADLSATLRFGRDDKGEGGCDPQQGRRNEDRRLAGYASVLNKPASRHVCCCARWNGEI